MPVFGQGTGGLTVLTGSCAGYYVGFVLMSLVITSLTQRYPNNGFWIRFGLVLLGNICMYIPGLCWLVFNRLENGAASWLETFLANSPNKSSFDGSFVGLCSGAVLQGLIAWKTKLLAPGKSHLIRHKLRTRFYCEATR